MSIRTIIEINHDFLHRLENWAVWRDLIYELSGTGYMPALNRGETPLLAPGVTVLAQRHHTESITIKVE